VSRPESKLWHRLAITAAVLVVGLICGAIAGVIVNGALLALDLTDKVEPIPIALTAILIAGWIAHDIDVAGVWRNRRT
jgi:H+/Cl- antiporter ClcA